MGGRFSEVTLLSSACKGLPHVYMYTHIHMYIHLPALTHIFTCESYSNTAWSWARRASHSPCQRHQETSPHFFSPAFSQEAKLPPETWGARGQKSGPVPHGWDLRPRIWPWSSPLHCKVFTSGKWKTETWILFRCSQQHLLIFVSYL